MARRGEELSFESECEDDYDGGVSLADYVGSIMEPDTHYPSLDYSDRPLEQESSSIYNQYLEAMASLDSPDTRSQPGSIMGPMSEAEAMASLEPVGYDLDSEADTADWVAHEPGLPGLAVEGYEPAIFTPTPQPPHSSFTDAGNPGIAPSDISSSSHHLDHGPNHTASDTVNNTTFDFSNFFAAAQDAESYYPYQYSGPNLQGPGLYVSGDIVGTYYDELKNMSFFECLGFWRDVHCKLTGKIPDHCGSMSTFFPPLRDADFPRTIADRYRPRGAETNVTKVTKSHVDKKECDFQGIKWEPSGLSPEDAREIRRRTYFNHSNMIMSYPSMRIFNGWYLFRSAAYIDLQVRRRASIIRSEERYFNFSRMDLDHPISIPHFQLRHIVSASSKNAVFYPTVPNYETGSRVTCVNPSTEGDDRIINCANVGRHSNSPRMQRIYTLTAKNDILITGGLHGDYAMKSLTTSPDSPFTSGMVTQDSLQSSTNHVHTFLDRRSGLPQAVFSSNDNHTHILDCMTNRFISHHNHVKAVNCAATSPDTRLRLLVRDAKHALIVEADTGKRIAKLSGHSDYGFACDWSDDGVHIATGAQDGLVQIYDMRSWHKPLQTLAAGCSDDGVHMASGAQDGLVPRNWRPPIQTLAAELGGIRTLSFSPLGSGPP
ncbi:MAG: hypothetical protein L6R39_004939, partial [Caloplaca ligustica]